MTSLRLLRAIGLAVGVAMMFGYVAALLVAMKLSDVGVIGMGSGDPVLHALDELTGPGLLLSLVGLVLAAWTFRLRASGFVVVLVLGVPFLIVLWVAVAGFGFGGYVGRPF
jgi:hypothetical protein